MLPDTPLKIWTENLLTTLLPENYVYHNWEHTLYVAEKSLEIGQAQKLTEKDKRLLFAASLLHDVGYICKYKGHEKESCEVAKNNLRTFGYSEEETDEILDLIMATKTPQHPKNMLQRVICDADLEYLGTENAEAFSQKLFKELHSLNPDLSLEEWNKNQVSFISRHHYHTAYCKKNKEPLKQQYLNKIMKNS